MTRVATWLVALIAGAVIGAVGTVAHVNLLVLGPVVIPAGLILGLVASLALMLGIRLVFIDRSVVFAAALGLVGVIAILTQEGPGGAVLISNSVISLVWTLGPVLIATLVLAWPRLRRITPVTPPAHEGDPVRA